LLVRGSLDDPHRRARLGAVLAIVGVFDVPLVVMATRWFRGMHPTSPGMEPAMRIVLWLSVFSFTGLFVLLLALRRRQLRQESLLAWGLSQFSRAPCAAWSRKWDCPPGHNEGDSPVFAGAKTGTVPTKTDA
jgi:hypothetical protein